MKRQFFGNPTLLKRARKPCMRYVLDWQEWHQLVDTSNSLSQLRSVWAHIQRVQPRIDFPHFTTALLHAFERRGSPDSALEVFDSIPDKISPSWVLVLSAASFARCLGPVTSLRKGTLSEAEKTFYTDEEKSQDSWNLMLAAYAQNGHLLVGKRFFDEMPTRDRSTWNPIMACFALNDDMVQCSEVFQRMPEWDSDSWTALLQHMPGAEIATGPIACWRGCR